MATITASTSEKVFQIKAFLGMNQNPDGDTKLKLGEASDIVNFRITRDRNLQKRPGTKTFLTVGNGPVKGLWDGYVNGSHVALGACDGKLYRLWDETSGEFALTELGSVDTTGSVSIFGFANNVYILDGHGYYQWDGTTFQAVEGYRPLVWISISPQGASDESSSLENVNRLTGKRRIWVSPDGTNSTYLFPETGISTVDYVMDNETGDYLVDGTDYTYDLTASTITFTEVQPQATNSFEIGYTAGTTYRSQVEAMTYAELYAGTQDTRIFLYGDGSNLAIYSGIDYNGNPRADYFPDLYEMRVGEENTPITGMIRHHSALICYKLDSSWSISSGSTTLADDLTIPSFYVTPINRDIGNVPMGQVRLILNSPYTLFGNDLYEWKNSSYYTSTLSRDERQAKRISDRIWSALSKFSMPDCYCYDDNDGQEYYICYNGSALVYNYASDAWYRYTNFPVACMVNIGDYLYIGTTDGKLKQLSLRWVWDDGEAIDSYWESGSMSFGQDYMRKYSAQLWIGVKPESHSCLNVTVQTDRNSTLQEKVVEYETATFAAMNFADFGFSTDRKPHIKRMKIKAKKFVYYKLILKNAEAGERATVVSADIRVRFTGMAK